MNDRLQALANQATEDILGEPILNQKRFAELIVRECGVALSPMLRDMISRGQAYNLIKQHFGIDHE